MLFPAGCRRRRGILATCAVDRPGPASQKGCLTVRSLLPYHMRRLANPDNLATTLRPRRMDGARPAMRARTSYNPLGGGHRTAADGGRGVRLDTC